MRPRLVTSLAVAVALSTIASSVHAQRGRRPSPPPPPRGGVHPLCSGCGGAPWIVLDAPTGTVTTQYPTINLQFCRNAYALDGSSRAIYINGTDRTSSFSYVSGDPHGDCGGGSGHAYSATSSVALTSGSNSIEGYICDDNSACADQTFNITYTPSSNGKPAVVLRNQNGDNVDRGLCLTLGAGQSAGIGCGDLFVAHGMPSYRTKGRDRSLTLVYSSAQANPRPVVAAFVSQPSGQTTPSSVFASLTVSGVLRDSATFSAIANGSPKQIVLGFDAVASGLSTGIYSFTLLVRNAYSGANYDSTLSGEVIVVNRSASEFGAGWWMSGLEQLVLGQSSNRLLWLAGDGSAAVYTPINDSTWVRAAAAFRDTLALRSSVYTRYLQRGIKVQFDNAGRHIRTINRVQDTTLFTWSGSPTRLASIRVPPSGASYTTYSFAWNGSSKLDSITDPVGRGLKATVTNDTLVSLRDPDGVSVALHYDSARRLKQRTNRRGYSTSYSYGDSLHVTMVVTPTNDTTRVRHWDAQGLAYRNPGGTTTPADTALSYTRIDGPRAGVADSARFWVDRWGAPIRAIDPLGNITSMTRGDATNPALITRMVAADGEVSLLTYTARGHLATMTDSAVTASGGSPTSAVTTFSYASPDTIDAPISVTDPTSVVTNYYYANGLTTKVVEPNGHKTGFAYNTGAQAGLLQSVTDSLVETMLDTVTWTDTLATVNLTTRFHYNSLGNVDSIIAPSGNATLLAYDSYQRVQYQTDAMGHRTQFAYNGLNWPTDIIARLDDQGGSALTTAHYHYTPNGDVDSLIDPRGVTRRWAYDASDRMIAAWDDFGAVDSLYLNRAGLPDYVRTRRHQLIYYNYDAAGRTTSTWWPSVNNDTPNGVTVPGDSINYTYDMGGRLTVAANGLGSIRRTYWSDGSVRADSQFIGSTPTFVNWYRYDLAGRRAWYFNGRDSTSYAYAAGLLAAMRVRWQSPVPSDSILFSWDGLGRRASVRYPNGTTLKLHYDRDSHLRYACAYHLTSTYNAGDDAQRFMLQVLSSNADGSPTRRRHVTLGSSCGSTNSSHLVHDDSTRLDNRHFMNWQSLTTATTFKSYTYEYDNSGNMARRTDNIGAVDLYAAVSGPHNRLLEWALNSNVQLSYGYDSSGNRKTEIAAPGSPPERLRYLFYDAANRQRGFVSYTGGSFPSACKIDALGRRINVCDTTSYVEGLDGNNVSQTSSGWRWVQGPGLDDPILGVFTAGSTTTKYYYFTDGNGGVLAVTDTAGGDHSDAALGGATAQPNTYQPTRAPSTAQALSGLSFFRNRYYDQNTGRWTQEDPIGPAGGVNLYAYAGNNPATFSDPFGLCPIPIDDCPPGLFTAMGFVIGGAAGGFGGGTTGLVACSPGGPTALVCGGGGALAGAAKGAVLGAGLGTLIDAGLALMSRSRGQGEAIDRAKSLLPQLGAHMDLLRGGGANDQDAPHHASEARAWLDRIERLTKQMRGRTQQQWKDLVNTLRNEINQIMGPPQ